MRQLPEADSCVPATCQRPVFSRVAGTVTRWAPRENVIVTRRTGAGGGRRVSRTFVVTKFWPGRLGAAETSTRRSSALPLASVRSHDGPRDGRELRAAGGSAREQERRGDEHADGSDRLGSQQSHRRPQAAHGEQAEQAEDAGDGNGGELGEERSAVGRREQRIETLDLPPGAVQAGDDDHGDAGSSETAEPGERLEHVAPLEPGQDERQHDETADPEAAGQDVRCHREDRERAE